jgi:hypothetical protein
MNLMVEALKFGFKGALKNFLTFLLVFVLIFVISFGSSFILILAGGGGSQEQLAFSLLSGSIAVIFHVIFLFLFQMLYTLGLVRISLNIVDGNKVSVKQLFGEVKLIIKYFLATLSLVLIFVAIGFVILVPLSLITMALNLDFVRNLLMIPMIFIVFYAVLRYRFYIYVLVDKNTGPIASLKESARITKGHVVTLLIWTVVIVLLYIAGTLLLLVGLLIAAPWILITDAYLYRKLSGAAPQNPVPATPAAPQSTTPEPEQPLVVPG